MSADASGWQPIETAPEDQQGLILLGADGVAYAPCQWQEPGVISEHGFWLQWRPGFDFGEIVNPRGWMLPPSKEPKQ